MRGQLGNLMQQAQRMQENLQKAQEELAQLEVTGSAGGGMVQVTLSGKMEARRVRIDQAAVGDDIEMLEDLLAAAINDAVNRVNEESGKRMAGMTAGLPLPPGMKIPGLF